MELHYGQPARTLPTQPDFPLSYRRGAGTLAKEWNWGLIISVGLSSLFWVGLVAFIVMELLPRR